MKNTDVINKKKKAERNKKPVKTKSADQRDVVLTPARQEFRRLSKAANQRFRDLEKAKLAEKSQSYAKAKEWIKENKKGLKGFTENENTIAKLSNEDYNKELYRIKKFLESKTSTPGKITKSEKATNKKLRERKSLKNYTDDELEQLRIFLGSKLTTALYIAGLDSDQITDEFKKLESLDLDSIIKHPELMTNKQKKMINDLFEGDYFKIEEVKPLKGTGEQDILFAKLK